MFGFSAADLAILIVYLLGTTALGLWMARTVHNTSDYFVGGRRFGKLLMIFHGFSSGAHTDQAVSVASKTYTSGISGIWYQWLYLPVTPFYWYFGTLMRRARAITTSDLYEARYDRSVATLFAVYGIALMGVQIGVMLKGTGAILIAVAGVTDPAEQRQAEFWAIGIVTVLFVVYGVAGGLAAAIATDFVQGLMTILFSFFILPFALVKVGGFSGLHEKLDPSRFHLVVPGDIGWFYIVVICINALVAYGTQPQAMPCLQAGKTEFESQLQAAVGTMIKRICTGAWAFTGLCALALYPDLVDPDKAYGTAARDLLASVGYGLIGLFAASMLAAVVGSCESFMLASAGLFTQNMYRPASSRGRPDWFLVGLLLAGLAFALAVARTLAPVRLASLATSLHFSAIELTIAGAALIIAGVCVRRRGPPQPTSEKRSLWVGRIAAACVVAGGIEFAFALDSVVRGLEEFFKISAMMGVAFWAGMFWRRATVIGAWASTLAATVAWYLTTRPFVLDWLAAHASFMLSSGAKPEMQLPWQMVIYMSVSVAGMFIGSWLSRPRPRHELDGFYAAFRTPAREGEVVTRPCCLPDDVPPAPERKLLPLSNWEFQRPTWFGTLAFIATAAAVGLLVLGMVGLLRIGARPS